MVRIAGSSADPIDIDVMFSDSSDGEWDDELVGRLNRARILQIDGEDRKHVLLRVTCEYDRSSAGFSHEWSFLDMEGNPLSRADPRELSVEKKLEIEEKLQEVNDWT